MGAIKPEKVWRVGDKIYERYSDAIRRAAIDRRLSLFDEVFCAFNSNMNWEGWTGAADEARDALKEALRPFTITRKRAE